MRPALPKISGLPRSALNRGASPAVAFCLLFAACESNPGDLIHKSSQPPGGGQTSLGGAPSDGKGGFTAAGAASGGVSAFGGASSAGGGAGGSSSTAGAGGTSSGGGTTSGGGTSGSGHGGTPSGGVPPNEGGSAGEGCGSEELCDGIDNDCDSRVDEDACAAGCVGFRVLERAMMACQTPSVADVAKERCAEQGMRLAWLDSRMKNRAVLMALQESELDLVEVFIGATDEENEGRWHWIGGSDFWRGADNGSSVSGAFANWASGKPNNAEEGQSCAVLIVDEPDDGQPGQWDDVGCMEEHGVLCESP